MHAIVCVLFTRVCIIVAGLKNNFAIIAGILFAVHPIHTEAVSERECVCVWILSVAVELTTFI